MDSALKKLIPREFQSTLAGVKAYAANALDFSATRGKILANKGLPKPDRKSLIVAEESRVEGLTLILFTYALYSRFQQGDRAIKNAVAVFTELGIPKVNIGTMELSRESRYYELGKELADALYACIEQPELQKMFRDEVKFHELADWYKKCRQ